MASLARRQGGPVQALVDQEVRRAGGGLEAALRESCGAVELQIRGPEGALRIEFDRSHLTPAFVRSVLRRKLRRYGGSLGGASGRKGRPGKEEG
jgi:hypothetical protein